MKKLIFLLLISSFAHAACYDITATCGEVIRTGNGKLVERLKPSLFGIIDKFVLRTKFENYSSVNEVSCDKKKVMPALEIISERFVAYTNFSDKEKFRELKKSLKNQIKLSKRTGHPVYACVGHINVSPFKYTGSQVYFSHESAEDAMAQMRKQARRHL